MAWLLLGRLEAGLNNKRLVTEFLRLTNFESTQFRVEVEF